MSMTLETLIRYHEGAASTVEQQAIATLYVRDKITLDAQAAMHRDAAELLHALSPRSEPVAWLHRPTGNVLDPADKAQIVERFTPMLGDRVATEFVPLYPLGQGAPAIVPEVRT